MYNYVTVYIYMYTVTLYMYTVTICTVLHDYICMYVCINQELYLALAPILMTHGSQDGSDTPLELVISVALDIS